MSDQDPLVPAWERHRPARRAEASRPANPWIVCTCAQAHPGLRLFCLPYAGGAASVYRDWHNAFGPNVEVSAVQLPGRENRLREPPIDQMALMIDRLEVALTPYMDAPYAFYGHSLGALLAYELTHRLVERGRRLPERLIAAGHRAPHLPWHKDVMHTQPDAGLIDGLRRYGGTSEAVLGNPELMALLLPVIRADLKLTEAYAYTERTPLDVPIIAIGANHDNEVEPEQVAAWERHTRGPFTLHMLDGDHFFVDAARELLVRSALLK